MALTFDPNVQDVLSLEDFVDYVDRCIEVDDPDSLCECAPALKSLLNNRSLISDVIARELRSWRDFQKGNAYVATTLILARTQRFFIRANMWLPDRPRSRAHADNTIYGLTHDHNFTFMTGGFHGSGYTTEIYELDTHAVRGLSGERVELEFLERTTLPEGKIMLYRAMQDVHRQSRPDELSISINLVVPTHTKTRPQYFFNLDRGEITHTEYPERGRALALFKLAQYAGDKKTHSLLGDIATTSANPRLRAVAYETLCECGPEIAAAVSERVLRDPDRHVRATAKRATPKDLASKGHLSQ